MSTGAIGSGHRNPWSKHLDENIKSVNEIIFHLAKEKSQVFNVHPVVCLRHPAQMHHQHLEGVQDHCAVNLGKHHLGWQTLIKTGWKVLKSTCMLLATSSPCGPVFLAASTNSLLKETQIYSQMTFLSPPVQVVREKRLRKFSEEKLQGSSNYCSVSAAVKSRPLILEKKGIFGEFCQSLPGPARPESSGSCWRHLQLCVEWKAQQEMVDVSNPTWNSVEPVSLEVFLLWFQLLHRLPDKRRNLDILPGSRLILGSIHSLLSWREKTWKSFCTAFTDGQVSRESLEESQEESNVLLQERAKTKYNFHLMFQEIKTNKQTKYLFQLLFQERATKKSSIPHICCNRTCDVFLQKQYNRRCKM